MPREFGTTQQVGDDDLASGAHHPRHLAHGGWLVREVGKGREAYDAVEDAVTGGNAHGRGLHAQPLGVAFLAARTADHLEGHVEGQDAPCIAHAIAKVRDEHSRARAHVQHAVTAFHAETRDERSQPPACFRRVAALLPCGGTFVEEP